MSPGAACSSTGVHVRLLVAHLLDLLADRVVGDRRSRARDAEPCGARELDLGTHLDVQLEA